MSRKHRRKKKDFFENYDYSQILNTAKPVCPHFGSCGGCRFQDIAYENQVQIKKDYLKGIFSKDIEVVPATGLYNYRNRMDFVYAFDCLGFRKRGDYKTVVDIDKCHLVAPVVQEVFTKIKTYLKESNIPDYDFIEKTGFLRYVSFRHAPSTNDLMVIFTSETTHDDDDLKLRFEEIVKKVSEFVKSVYWLAKDNLTDAAVPVTTPTMQIGEENITENLNGKKYLISPWSFFQANSLMSTAIFDDIKRFVHGNTVDLCCGVGAIGIYVADNCTSIVGVEEVESAIELAEKNKVANEIKNANYFCRDMKHFAEVAALDIDTMVLDPPRAGLNKKVVKRLLEAMPETIIYMSCNPKTQKVDLDMINASEVYEEIYFKAYDMFPQTPHVETLTVLKRKDTE